MKNVYVGAAGVLFALDLLRRREVAETRLDLPDLAIRDLELFRQRPHLPKGMKLPEPAESALLTGDTGILLVAWRPRRSRRRALRRGLPRGARQLSVLRGGLGK